MSNETIGLTVDIDGSIAKGKAKVDELAAYAKRMLGSAFSFPSNTPGGKPKLLDQFGREIDVAVEKTKKAKSAIQQQFESLIKDIRRAEREAKSIGLADAMTNASRPTAKLIRDFSELSNKMSGLRDKVGGFYDRFSNGSNSSVRALSRLYDNIARVERAMSGVGKRIGEAGSPSLNAASRKLNILDNSDVLGTASAIRSASADAIRPLQEQAAQVKALIRDIQKTSLVEHGNEDIQRLRSSLDSVKAAGVSAMSSVNSEIKGVDKATDALVASLRVANAELNRLESNGKANAFQKYGMFNNKGISPIFTAQQIVEDYSYAGMRGAANNIAFLLAELAPDGGIGAKLAGGGILALMTYQFYEMGKAMKWWGAEASRSAEDAKRLTGNLKELSGSIMSINLASAAMSGQSASLGFSSAFMGQRGAAYANSRNASVAAMMRGPLAGQLIRSVAENAASNPSAYLGVAGLGVPSEDATGMKRAYLSQIAALQVALGKATGAAGGMPSAAPGSPSLTYLEDFGGTLWDLMAGKEDALTSRAARGEKSKNDLVSALKLAGTPGQRLADQVSSMPAGSVDYTSIVKKLKDEVQNLQNSFDDLVDTQTEAMRQIRENSEDAARSILTAAQSNNAVADSVQKVIQGNRELNEAYQRQMGLLKNLEILKERDQFRSSAFSLMRSKGAQFMEEAGLPQWMIERRNMALYERQAGFLFSSSQAAGAAGDTRGQIEYLKQIQQLQFEVIGNTNNRAVAESVMERAIRVQHEIESLIRLNQQQGQAEYEMVQKLTMGLVDMRDIINSMPPIRLGALQQAGEVAQLNAQLAILRNGVAEAPPLTGIAASIAKFGEMPLPGFNKGGHIPGYGGGDKVPALLEKGEFVINKNAVRTLGVDTMHEINAAGNVRKFAKGGWSGTGYGMVHSTYPGQRRRAARLRAGQSWYRDHRGQSASAWARDGVREIREKEASARNSERNWMAMSGRAAGQISNWGTDEPTGIEATLGAPGSISTNPAARRARGAVGMFGGGVGSSSSLGEPGAPFGAGFSSVGDAPLSRGMYPGWRYPGVRLSNRNGHITGTFSRDVYSSNPNRSQALGSDGYYGGSMEAFKEFSRYPMRDQIRANGGTVMQRAPDGTFSWNGIGHFSQRDFMAHMRQRNGGMLNVNWGRTLTLPGDREVNTQYGQTGEGWMAMRMRQRQATANLMSERARQAQAAASASKLRYARQAQAISNAGANRRAVGAFYASRNGMTPQQVYQMRMSRLYGGRWGGNFNNYVGQMFGPGFSPFMGGGFPQMGGGTGWGNSYGLYDSGPALMGLRAFARGGYVTKDGGRLISLNPDVFQDDTDWEFMGGYPSNGPDMNYMSFMDQRNRVLAGSYNRSDLGAMDFAGNQLGSFGQFSDGSYRSRYSGGFSSVGRGQGFSSGMGGKGFSSFGRPIGAMTGGFITQGAGIQRYATGGLVRGGTTTSSSSTVNNNFGTVRIEVKSPKDAADATAQMRRSKSSYWAQKG